MTVNYHGKKFITLAPGAVAIKLYEVVVYKKGRVVQYVIEILELSKLFGFLQNGTE